MTGSVSLDVFDDSKHLLVSSSTGLGKTCGADPFLAEVDMAVQIAMDGILAKIEARFDVQARWADLVRRVADSIQDSE